MKAKKASTFASSETSEAAGIFIAPGVILTCAGHPVVAEQKDQGIETSKPITIGNSVWIGAHATICGGVKIGDYAVIGTSGRRLENQDTLP